MTRWQGPYPTMTISIDLGDLRTLVFLVIFCVDAVCRLFDFLGGCVLKIGVAAGHVEEKVMRTFKDKIEQGRPQ